MLTCRGKADRTRSRGVFPWLLAALAGFAAGPGCRPTAPPPGLGATEAGPGPAPGPDRDDDRGAEARGLRIYRTGRAGSGRPIAARFGNPPVEVPGTLLACVNCHGHDGLGRAEGGLRPPDITWQTLTKPYGATAADGRRRPAYTEGLLRRALTLGFDSRGAPLDAAMPRYQFTRDDLDDLILYLKLRAVARDPGLSDSIVRLGVILAPGPLGEESRALLSAYFDGINGQGGLFGRRIEARFVESPEAPEERAEAAAAFLAGEEVFALVGPFLAGAEGGIVATAERAAVPIVGPLIQAPAPGSSTCRYVFYLDEGVTGQARALAAFAIGRHRNAPPRGATILRGVDRLSTSLARAIREDGERAGWTAFEEVDWPVDEADGERVARGLQAGGVAVVFAVGSGEDAGALLRAAAAIGWHPEVLLPVSRAGRDALAPPRSFGGRIFLAMPAVPTDQTPEAAREYRELARGRALPGRPGAAHRAVLGAARVFVEALRRAGRDLSRERAIEALEGLHEFRTGYTPPITFGPDRRVGARGANIVAIDPASGRVTPVGGRQAIDPNDPRPRRGD